MKIYREYIFPKLLEHASQRFDDDRKRLLRHASGVVLELGVGTGQALPFYSDRVAQVIALEPEAALLQKARLQVLNTRTRVRLLQGKGEALPLASESFDTVVCFLVLCSVQQPRQVLRELFRVLKPGGQILVFEHVAAETPTLLRWQRRLNPFWQPLACGCHLHRNTLMNFSEAGFDCTGLAIYRSPALPALVGTLLEGVAFKPAEGSALAREQSPDTACAGYQAPSHKEA